MSSAIERLNNRKKNRKYIEDIYLDKSNTYIIHYSCQSFYNNSKSVRVTSIGVRNLESAQTHYWSMWHASEKLKIEPDCEEHLDILEKSILDSYFDFLKNHQTNKYLHWNMRDANYGFQALEHRYEVLGETPIRIPDSCKFDLARILVALYGRNYANHSYEHKDKVYSGRMMVLAVLNNVAIKDAMSGKEEAEAFEQSNYQALHLSTSRKLDMIANFFDRTHANTLKHNGTFKEIYGFHLSTLPELVKNNPLYTALGILGTIIGIIWKFI